MMMMIRQVDRYLLLQMHSVVVDDVCKFIHFFDVHFGLDFGTVTLLAGKVGKYVG